jgi:hypothetical protein
MEDRALVVYHPGSGASNQQQSGEPPILILGRAELERLLAPADVIAAVRSAFRQYAEGLSRVLPRQGLALPDDGLLLVMPSALLESRALGTKLVTVYGRNRERGLPTIYASYVLQDLEDAATARLAYDRALAAGVGQLVSLE